MGAYDNPTWQVDKSREILIKNMTNTMQIAFSTIEKKKEYQRQKKEKADALLSSNIAVSDAKFDQYADNIEASISKLGVDPTTKDDFLDDVYYNLNLGKKYLAEEFRNNPNLTDGDRTEMMRIELGKVKKMSESLGFGKINMETYTAGTTNKKVGDPGRIYHHNDISRDVALLTNDMQKGGAKAEWNEGTNDWNYFSKDGSVMMSGDDMKKFYADGGFKTLQEIPKETPLTKFIEDDILDTKKAIANGWAEVKGNRVVWDKDKIEKHLEGQSGLFDAYRRNGESHYQHIFSKELDENNTNFAYEEYGDDQEKELLFGDNGILKELMKSIPDKEVVSVAKEKKLQAEFDKKWAALKPGETLMGPDGQIHKKTK